MKKILPGLFAMALAVAACQTDGYKVNGVAEGFSDGDTLYFYSEMGNSQEPTSTLLVKDGTFHLEGVADSVTLASVVAADGSAGALFFCENGDINVVISRSEQPKVGGTKANDAWQQLNDVQTEFSDKFDRMSTALYSEEITGERRDSLMSEYAATEKEMMAKVIDIAEANLDNEMGFFVVTSMAGSQEIDPERLKSMIGRMPAEYQQRQQIADIKKLLAAAENVAKGKTMPAFSLPTPEGKELSVVEEVAKNKITILDFWASWCGPCCEEMPNMVSIYGKYKDKGLGIIGISLDNDKEAWTKALVDMNMTWTQVGDMKGWKTEAVELFQVSAIPFVVVVDQKGTILEKSLRGKALEAFIGEQL